MFIFHKLNALLLFLLPVILSSQPNVFVKSKIPIGPYSPTLILYNANVKTFDQDFPVASAIAIQGKFIIQVATDEDILSLQTESTQLIDMKGSTVVPGLIEGHTHFLKNGFQNDGIEGLRRNARLMALDGYTTAQELGWDVSRHPGFIEAAAELANRGELAVRMNVYLAYNNNCGDTLSDNWSSYPYTFQLDTMVRVVGIKAFSDGGSCGASCISTIYQGSFAEGTHGTCYSSQSEWDSDFAEILGAGYPIAMHAIGDSAIGISLNAFESAFEGGENVLRCRMEHLRVMREDLVGKMANLGVAASIQYTWARAARAASFQAVYLPEVLEWFFPWRRMVDNNIRIIGGNDSPTFSYKTNAMQTISILATRLESRDAKLADWLDGDQLTIEEGLYGMTINNAWANFEESVKGTITPNKLADLTILKYDPTSTDPFDVRDIPVEMTIVDGVIRFNNIGVNRIETHDAGTFSINIDNAGLWGAERLPFGLLYNEQELLYNGSVLVSYDESTIATALTPQQDFINSSHFQFLEDEANSLEVAKVIFEDDVLSHPGKIGITQKTFMFAGDPFLLIKYSFKNIGSGLLPDVYFGQTMKFSIGDFTNNIGAWEENEGLGIAYMYENDNPVTPYIGLVMFDSSGESVNTSLALNIQGSISNFNDEQIVSMAMRSDSIEINSASPGNYAVIPAIGPFSLEQNDSISPFLVAVIVGESLDDLKDAANMAFQKSSIIMGLNERKNTTPKYFVLFQNYPNPFNSETKIEFGLPNKTNVEITIFNLLGQKVETILKTEKAAGLHSVHYVADHLSSGVYFYSIKTKNDYRVKKMLLIK